jgi:hypothetical protein
LPGLGGAPGAGGGGRLSSLLAGRKASQSLMEGLGAAEGGEDLAGLLAQGAPANGARSALGAGGAPSRAGGSAAKGSSAAKGGRGGKKKKGGRVTPPKGR